MWIKIAIVLWFFALAVGSGMVLGGLLYMASTPIQYIATIFLAICYAVLGVIGGVILPRRWKDLK